jgi:hypothetical protein
VSTQKLINPFGHSRKVDSLPKCLLEINVISVRTLPWIVQHTEPVFITYFNGYFITIFLGMSANVGCEGGGSQKVCLQTYSLGHLRLFLLIPLD